MSFERTFECLLMTDILLIEKDVRNFAEINLSSYFSDKRKIKSLLKNRLIKTEIIDNKLYLYKYNWQIEFVKCISCTNEKRNKNFRLAISKMLLN